MTALAELRRVTLSARAHDPSARCTSCGRRAVPGRGTFAFTMDFVCAEYALTPEELVSDRRYANLVEARAMLVWALRTLWKQRSYPMIGRMLGGRDHSTIQHLHRKALYLRASDPDFNEACAVLAAQAAKREEHYHGSGQ